MKNKSRLEIVGHTKIWLRRKSGLIERIVDKPNTISAQLRAAFKASWLSGTNDFALNDLFTANEEIYAQAPPTQGSKDGIIAVGHSGTNIYSAITTSETAAETYGSKWRGEVVFSGPETVISAVLGHEYTGIDSTDMENLFDITYAYQIFTATDVDNLDRLIFEWEIYS